MDLRSMEYFCAIVEEGQISKAAKRLNLSQPPLSLRLKEIEQEIGCPLILRSPGVWKVTAEGRLLYNKCRQILTHIQGLPESVRNASDQCRGSVRIGIGSHCVSFFQKIVPELTARYPDISCRTVIADSPTVERYLQEREVEVAILRLNLVNNNCNLYNLPRQRLLAVFSHLVQPPPPEPEITFSHLADYPLLFSRRWADSDGFRPIIAAFQSRGQQPKIILDTQMPWLLFELLYTTPAVAIMPDTEIPQYRPHSFPIRAIDHYVRFQPVVAYLQEAYLSPQANAVIELLKESWPTPGTWARG